MKLPEQLLLSDLLRLRVRSDQGIDHGPGVLGWMHPPVHRLLGWISRPSAFGSKRLVWRLNQLRGLSEQEAFVKGEPATTDPATLRRLPTLFEAALMGAGGVMLGSVADAAIELRTGRIRHYLIARSDPRLPGSSRWRLDPARIVDQQPGQVITSLQGLDDLPLARASVRQQFLRRSRRWRERVEEETTRLRGRLEDVGGQVEDRLEGWLEEPPWQEPVERQRRTREEGGTAAMEPDPLEDWSDWEDEQEPEGQPEREGQPRSRRGDPARRRPPLSDVWDEI